MKKFTEAALTHATRPNPLLSLVEDGHTPDEIKQLIITALQPYFKNQDVLKEHAIDLAGELVNLAYVTSDSHAEVVFAHTREIYLRAQAVDANATLRCCAHSETHIEAGVAEYWSLLYLEVAKSDLDLPELKHEVFRNVGTLLEACMQPFLREVLAMLRIARGQTCDYSDLLTLSLGQIVGELADVTLREDNLRSATVAYSPQPVAQRCTTLPSDHGRRQGPRRHR